MKLMPGVCWTKAAGSDKELKWLRGYLTIRVNANESECLLGVPGRAEQNEFPAGLTRAVRKAAKSAGLHVACEPGPELPQLVAKPNLSWLRDYQLEGIGKALARGRGIIWVPVGGGKGDMSVAVAWSITVGLQSGITLFLVHRENLALDIAARWTARTGLRAGVIARSRWDVQDDDRFVVSTFPAQAAAWRRNDLRAEDLAERTVAVIVDECHTAPASTHRAVIQRLDKAHYRVGFSGSPLDRSDHRTAWATGSLGPLIYRIRPELLIERGFTSQCHATFVQFQHKAMPAERDGFEIPWGVRYAVGIVRNQERNTLLAKIAKKVPKPALLFVQRDEHGETMLAECSALGIRAIRVWGESSVDERHKAEVALTLGEVDVVICSVVWQEGLNIRSLATVINGGGGKSVIGAIQRSGRGARTTDEKATYTLVDIYDRATQYYSRKDKKTGESSSAYNGFYMFDRWSDKRVSTYQREAHQIEILTASDYLREDNHQN